MRAVVLLIPLLAACGPKPHPLQSQRELLDGVVALPAPEQWEPQVVVHASEPMVQEVIELASQHAPAKLPDTVVVEVPLLGSTELATNLQPPKIGLSSSTVCETCVQVDADLTGTVEGLPWTATGVAVMRFGAEDTTEGHAIMIRPELDGPSVINAKFVGTAPLAEALLSAVLTTELIAQMEVGALAGPGRVVRLPPKSGLRIQALSIDADDGVKLGAAFAVQQAGIVVDVPDPGDGLVIVLPADTMLGLAHAAAVRQDTIAGFAAEPTSLSFRNGEFQFGLRLWRAARRPKFRDYRVRGTLKLDEDSAIAFDATHAEVIDKRGWFGDPFGAIVNQKLLAGLEQASGATLPGGQPIRVGSAELIFHIWHMEAHDDRIVVWARLEPMERSP